MTNTPTKKAESSRGTLPKRGPSVAASVKHGTPVAASAGVTSAAKRGSTVATTSPKRPLTNATTTSPTKRSKRIVARPKKKIAMTPVARSVKNAILDSLQEDVFKALEANQGRLPHKWIDKKIKDLSIVAPWINHDHIKYQVKKVKKKEPDKTRFVPKSSNSTNGVATAPTKTEKEKMMAGELYQAFDPVLLKERNQAKHLCFELNQTSPLDTKKRKEITKKILGKSDALIESPFNCDFGYNIKVGKNFYANHGCTILDCNTVKIGDNCLLGPSVVISAATHPLDANLRQCGDELTAPITIGNNVWIGAHATICQGVTLGDNVVVGAGAVVNKNIPSNVVCGGVPVKILRYLGITEVTSAQARREK